MKWEIQAQRSGKLVKVDYAIKLEAAELVQPNKTTTHDIHYTINKHKQTFLETEATNNQMHDYENDSHCQK